uniref:Uncharacterized protein n=1 Tax=Romanomermis culicivorax TaxID=13658 RepID=A0A915KU88_ROMCU
MQSYDWSSNFPPLAYWTGIGSGEGDLRRLILTAACRALNLDGVVSAMRACFFMRASAATTSRFDLTSRGHEEFSDARSTKASPQLHAADDLTDKKNPAENDTPEHC